jgi:hypothetical protein
MLPKTLRYRLSAGWPVEDAVARAVTHSNRHGGPTWRHKANWKAIKLDELGALNRVVARLMEEA